METVMMFVGVAVGLMSLAVGWQGLVLIRLSRRKGQYIQQSLARQDQMLEAIRSELAALKPIEEGIREACAGIRESLRRTQPA